MSDCRVVSGPGWWSPPARLLVAACLCALVLPSAASARRSKAPQAVGVLDSLTQQVTGSFGRSSSASSTSDVLLGPGESIVLANIEGPAVIDRLWIAIEGSETFWRDIVLRITWDGGAAPSVEAPIGDFFAVGPGARQNVQSVPLAVQSGGRALSSFWKMPFAESARVTLVNEGASATRQLTWEIDYRVLKALPKDSLYFHAQYTQSPDGPSAEPLTVLRASGSGQYVGLSVAAQITEPGAWGTGGVHFDVDGSGSSGDGINLLHYFGNVFGLGKISGPFQGATLDEGDRVKARSSLYRFHISDPIPFQSSLEVRLERGPDNSRADRLSGVAYWYQDIPAVPFDKLTAVRRRRWPAPTDQELALWKRADTLNQEVLDAYRREDFASALTLLEELLQLEPDSAYASYNLACLYALDGQSDRALHMLQQAVELGFSELSFARHDPDLKSLHDSERFRRLVGVESSSAPESGQGG